MQRQDSFEDDDECCPICIEPFDTQDQCFLACPCNYRVCMFCVRRIRTEFDARCPGCRRDYDESNFRFIKIEESDRAQRLKERQAQPRHRRQGSAGKNDEDETEEFRPKDLANVRVVQDNLVYLIGLAPSIGKEEVLRSNRFFGQYGKIIKVVISRNANTDRGSTQRSPSSSAYITFSKAEDAKVAIQAANGFWVDNQMIRASYGTTKYCNMFLRNLPCNNPECLYLHKLGAVSSSFTKEQMQQAGRFQEVSHNNTQPPGLDGRAETTCLPARWTEPSTRQEAPQEVRAPPSSPALKSLSTNAWGNKSRVSSLATNTTSNGSSDWASAVTSLPEEESSITRESLLAEQRDIKRNVSHDVESDKPTTSLLGSLGGTRVDVDKESETGSRSLLSMLGGMDLREYNKLQRGGSNRSKHLTPIGQPVRKTIDNGAVSHDANGLFKQDYAFNDTTRYSQHQENTAFLQSALPNTRISLAGEALGSNDINMTSFLQTAETSQENNLLWNNDSFEHKAPGLRYTDTTQQTKFHILSNVHRGKTPQEQNDTQSDYGLPRNGTYDSSTFVNGTSYARKQKGKR